MGLLPKGFVDLRRDSSASSLRRRGDAPAWSRAAATWLFCLKASSICDVALAEDRRNAGAQLPASHCLGSSRRKPRQTSAPPFEASAALTSHAPCRRTAPKRRRRGSARGEGGAAARDSHNTGGACHLRRRHRHLPCPRPRGPTIALSWPSRMARWRGVLPAASRASASAS